MEVYEKISWEIVVVTGVVGAPGILYLLHSLPYHIIPVYGTPWPLKPVDDFAIINGTENRKVDDHVVCHALS